MRNYWLKILLGALGIFAIGMIGVSLVRGGVAKVSSVVEGDGPITIPLGLIPFVLGGERLGKLNHVTLNRESPSNVSDVELSIDLSDSLVAQGLSGCRLVANLEDDKADRGVNIRVGQKAEGAFRCLAGDSTPADLVEYGVAIFQPGEIEVPLLLSTDLVEQLRSLDFGHDSASADGDSLQINVPDADSIEAAVARQIANTDSIRQASDSIVRSTMRMRDSLVMEAKKRIAEEAEGQ